MSAAAPSSSSPAPAASPLADPTIAAALTAAFGPWGAVAAVALRWGPDFVEGLIRNAKERRPVTLEEWAALRAKIATPFDEL